MVKQVKKMKSHLTFALLLAVNGILAKKDAQKGKTPQYLDTPDMINDLADASEEGFHEGKHAQQGDMKEKPGFNLMGGEPLFKNVDDVVRKAILEDHKGQDEYNGDKQHYEDDAPEPVARE